MACDNAARALSARRRLNRLRTRTRCLLSAPRSLPLSSCLAPLRALAHNLRHSSAPTLSAALCRSPPSILFWKGMLHLAVTSAAKRCRVGLSAGSVTRLPLAPPTKILAVTALPLSRLRRRHIALEPHGALALCLRLRAACRIEANVGDKSESDAAGDNVAPAANARRVKRSLICRMPARLMLRLNATAARQRRQTCRMAVVYVTAGMRWLSRARIRKRHREQRTTICEQTKRVDILSHPRVAALARRDA